jgi:RNA polymerase sigma-70 factor, ECF subfamily
VPEFAEATLRTRQGPGNWRIWWWTVTVKSIQLFRPDRRSSAGGESTGDVGPRAEQGLEQLYATHGRAIFIHCVRLLGDAASAEDATQEVFLRVRRHAGRAPEPTEMRPWLFRIATNHCLNELRSRGVRARTPPQLTGLVTSNLEDSLAAQNDARRFLERLPERARAIAWLTYVDGMMQHEVAETLGVSRRTVVNYLSQVRTRLQQTTRGGLAMAR